MAIATDYNPGTNPCLDPWLIGTIAATQMKMTIEEVIQGFTIHAARSLGLDPVCGSVAKGKRMDLVLLDAPNETIPFYRYGQNCVAHVICNGERCQAPG